MLLTQPKNNVSREISTQDFHKTKKSVLHNGVEDPSTLLNTIGHCFDIVEYVIARLFLLTLSVMGFARLIRREVGKR
jgi:hypothetical protein